MTNSLSILPLSPEELESGVAHSVSRLVATGLSEEEAALQIAFDFETWLADKATSRTLPPGLLPVFEYATWEALSGSTRGKTYENLIGKIRKRFSMSRRHAAIVLSQLPLILILAQQFSASSARIAAILEQTEARVAIGWRLVEMVLVHFKIPNSFEIQAVGELIERDKNSVPQELGDADTATLVDILSNRGADLGTADEFGTAIECLLQEEKVFIPYLQILFYICTINHFRDHPPEYLYTFKPRSELANAIFDVFPSQLAPRGNPFLNNFKAVDRITPDWAESRKGNREKARALVTVVETLSLMSYSPRRQISALIRQTIIRYIEINTPAAIHLESITDLSVATRFLRRVAAAPTNTQGVIEQRVVDFLSALEFALPDWRPRGLGDPVNATNSSSRKLGDCDFQNITERRCIAVEAHAGRLTDVYVREHLRTLRLNLPARLEEWSRISESDEWQWSLRFIVHSDGRSVSAGTPSGLLTGSLEVLTFADLLERMIPHMEACGRHALDLFNRRVVEPLDSRNTPFTTKVKAISLFED